MGRFILRRVLLVIPVLVGLTVIMFVISRMLPGDPLGLAAGPNATWAPTTRGREAGSARPAVVTVKPGRRRVRAAAICASVGTRYSRSVERWVAVERSRSLEKWAT